MDTERFSNAYIEAALWSSPTGIDGGPEYLDQVDADLSDEARQAMIADCVDFIGANAADLDEYDEAGYGPEQAGHDFWLTRNGHGAGFWDRGAGKVGDRLSDAAKVYGDCDLYISDDGEIDAD